MRRPPRILIVDDQPMNVDILQTRLTAHGYDILAAPDGETALSLARTQQPDLILLDIMMPKLDGIEVCRLIKGDPCLPFMPIIMITAKVDSPDVVAGLEAGAEEYLTKPIDQAALVARVRSMLRIKDLHDTVQEQAVRLEAQADRLTEWNQTLEARVQRQIKELERLTRLRRFLAPQLAELIASDQYEQLLESHRREVTVVFCDLRGFTAFSEAAAPQEVMGVLDAYYAAMGELIFQYEGTLEHFAGDGFMVFFNDPLPCSNPSTRAVLMAVTMRQRVGELAKGWRTRGHHLDFGVGIAHGEATLGKIGFEGRFEYAAIGTVTNLASRLCAEAAGGQILISEQGYAGVEHLVVAKPVAALRLKGFAKPVPAFSVLALKDAP